MKIELRTDTLRIRISKTLSTAVHQADHRSPGGGPRTARAAIAGAASANSFLSAPSAETISTTISTGHRFSKPPSPAPYSPSVQEARRPRRSVAVPGAGAAALAEVGARAELDAVAEGAPIAGGPHRPHSQSQTGSGVPTAVVSPEAPADSLAQALGRSMAPALEFLARRQRGPRS